MEASSPRMPLAINRPTSMMRMRGGREALVVIDDLSTITSSLKPRELLEATEWAKQHTHVLVAKWQELNP